MPKAKEIEEDDLFETEEEDDGMGWLDEEDEVEEESEDEEVADDVEDDLPAFDPAALSKRIDDIQNVVNSIPNMIATSISTALGKGKIREIEEEEEDVDDDTLEDPKKVYKLVNKRIDMGIKRGIEQAMKPHEQALSQAAINDQFQKAAVKYGDDFVNAMPQVAKLIYRSEGKFTAEEAYEAYLELVGKSARKVSTNKKTVNAKQFVQRTAKAKVDADSRETVGEPRARLKKIDGMSDEQVFSKSFDFAIRKATGGRGLKR